jgi:hypothetical protein
MPSIICVICVKALVLLGVNPERESPGPRRLGKARIGQGLNLAYQMDPELK